MRVFSPPIILWALATLTLAVAAFAVSTGAMRIGLASVLSVFGTGATLSETESHVLLHIRMPRVLMAFATGGSLAIAGTALQGLFRNPLADPGLVGVSSGAALGAVAVIVLSPFAVTDVRTLFAQPLAAFACGLAVSALVYRLAVLDGRVNMQTMLLAGIAVNAIAAAGIGWLSYASTEDQLRLILFWTLGSFSAATWLSCAIAAVIALASAIVILTSRRALNALLLGEREALYLGVDVARVKRRLVGAAVLATAGGTAFVGIIGFIGLVAPHIVRLMTGPDHRFVLPGSFLLGGALAVGADTLARSIVAPAEMPLGIIMAAVGGPFFLALLWRNRTSLQD
jgi:iron complex transport system permease protein